MNASRWKTAWVVGVALQGFATSAYAQQRAPWDTDGDPFAAKNAVAQAPPPPSPPQSNDAPKTTPVPEAPKKADTVRFALRGLATAGGFLPTDTAQNPDNGIFRLPRQFMKLEARPDLTASSGGWTVHAKPRGEVEFNRVNAGDHDTKSRAYLLEWYARWEVVPPLHLSVGSEYLQWGPSQLISPSNVFFVENARINPIAQIPGSYFARAVWVMSPRWTASGIVNFAKGEEQLSYRPFERRYALKLDYSGDELQVSGLASYGERSSMQFGAYAVWVPTEALLLYTDVRMDTRSRVLYPEATPATPAAPFGVEMRERDGTWNPAVNALAGASYTFKSNLTVAAEYLYQSDGYKSAQARDLGVLRERLSGALVGQGPNASDAALAGPRMNDAFNPGLRFSRQHYSVVQMRYQWADGDATVSLWWICNLNDGSQSIAPSFDIAITDHIALVGFGTLNLGAKSSELHGAVDVQALFGASYTF